GAGNAGGIGVTGQLGGQYSKGGPRTTFRGDRNGLPCEALTPLTPLSRRERGEQGEAFSSLFSRLSLWERRAGEVRASQRKPPHPPTRPRAPAAPAADTAPRRKADT